MPPKDMSEIYTHYIIAKHGKNKWQKYHRTICVNSTYIKQWQNIIKQQTEEKPKDMGEIYLHPPTTKHSEIKERNNTERYEWNLFTPKTQNIIKQKMWTMY